MSTVIEEGALRFEFGDGWRVVKYDDHPDYRKYMEKLNGSLVERDGTESGVGTRGVDIVGVYRENAPDDGEPGRTKTRECIYFIEIKDLRGHRIENKKRVRDKQLGLEVGIKVRDTIAGIVAAFRRHYDPVEWEPFARALMDRSGQVHVVLWLEQDQGPELKRRRGHPDPSMSDFLKGKLSWLAGRVIAINRSSCRIPDLEVMNIPRQSER